MKGYRGFIQITKYWKQPKGPLTGKLINRQCDLQAMDCYSRGRTSEPKNLKRMMPRSQTEKVMYCINLLHWQAWKEKKQKQKQTIGREVPLEKEMATHSSTLGWKIPWTEEPGRLQLMGSQRVGHDWATSLHFTIETRADQWLPGTGMGEELKLEGVSTREFFEKWDFLYFDCAIK